MLYITLFICLSVHLLFIYLFIIIIYFLIWRKLHIPDFSKAAVCFHSVNFTFLCASMELSGNVMVQASSWYIRFTLAVLLLLFFNSVVEV